MYCERYHRSREDTAPHDWSGHWWIPSQDHPGCEKRKFKPPPIYMVKVIRHYLYVGLLRFLCQRLYIPTSICKCRTQTWEEGSPVGLLNSPNLPSPQPPNLRAPLDSVVPIVGSRGVRTSPMEDPFQILTCNLGSGKEHLLHIYISLHPSHIAGLKTRGEKGALWVFDNITLHILPPFTSRGGSFPDFGLNVLVRKGVQFLQIHISVQPSRTAGRTSTRGREVLPHSIHLPPLPQSF